MVLAALSLTIEGPERDQVVRSLRALSGPTRLESGCLACRVFTDTDDCSKLLYLEMWDTGEQLVTRLRSKSYRHVLAAMEESVAPPELQFYWISEVKGIEFLEATRLNSTRRQLPLSAEETGS